MLHLNLLSGAVYLPWQWSRLRTLRANVGWQEGAKGPLTRDTLARGLHQMIREKSQTAEAQAWDGLVGVIWMAPHWATLLPIWV